MLHLSKYLLCPPLPLPPLVTVNTHSLAEQLITVRGLALEERPSYQTQSQQRTKAYDQLHRMQGKCTMGGGTNNDYR